MLNYEIIAGDIRQLLLKIAGRQCVDVTAKNDDKIEIKVEKVNRIIYARGSGLIEKKCN